MTPDYDAGAAVLFEALELNDSRGWSRCQILAGKVIDAAIDNHPSPIIGRSSSWVRLRLTEDTDGFYRGWVLILNGRPHFHRFGIATWREVRAYILERTK